jgi:hypothetical protein
MCDELTQLREEVARLRRDLDHVLKLLGETNYELTSPRKERAWLQPQCVQIMGGKGEHMPVEISGNDECGGIYFYDKAGRCRGALVVTEQGLSLAFKNEDGKPGVSIGAAKGHGELAVFSPDGKPKVIVKSGKLGGSVNCVQSSGQPAVYMLAGESGGKLEIVNQMHRSSVSLFHDETGAGIVRLHESSGEPMVVMGCTADSGLMTVFGPLGEEAVILCSAANGGAVVVCDENGNQRAAFPNQAA